MKKNLSKASGGGLIKIARAAIKGAKQAYKNRHVQETLTKENALKNIKKKISSKSPTLAEAEKVGSKQKFVTKDQVKNLWGKQDKKAKLNYKSLGKQSFAKGGIKKK